MEESKSYEEWYNLAKNLDISQGRDNWQNNVNDDTAYRYSWVSRYCIMFCMLQYGLSDYDVYRLYSPTTYSHSYWNYYLT